MHKPTYNTKITKILEGLSKGFLEQKSMNHYKNIDIKINQNL